MYVDQLSLIHVINLAGCMDQLHAFLHYVGSYILYIKYVHACTCHVQYAPTGGGLGRWVWLTSILATAGVLLVARRRWFPRQQEVVGSLLPLLRSVPEVRALVGSNLTPGGVTKVTRHYWGRSLRQWNKSECCLFPGLLPLRC